MDMLQRIVRLETTLWTAMERSLLGSGEVGLGTLLALRILDSNAGAGRVYELSRELAITVGAASKVVDRLERDGLAVRRPNPGDRRSSMISLTAQGKVALASADAVVRRETTAMFGDEALMAAGESLIDRLQERVDLGTVVTA